MKFKGKKNPTLIKGLEKLTHSEEIDSLSKVDSSRGNGCLKTQSLPNRINLIQEASISQKQN